MHIIDFIFFVIAIACGIYLQVEGKNIKKLIESKENKEAEKKMKRKEKIALAGVLIIGIFGIIRCYV